MKHAPKIVRARRLRQTQSVAEGVLWQALRRNQLHGWGFRRQSPLGEFVVDFLCHKPKLIVEVDGPVHDDAERQAFDTARTAKLEALDYLLIRVKERAVREDVARVTRWIGAVGYLVMNPKFVPADMRELDRLPLP